MRSDKGSALVTGASRGIGRAIALELAGCGYDLVISARASAEKLEDAKHEIMEKGVRCLSFLGDMGNAEDVRRMYAAIREEGLSLPSVVVNNAGISFVGLITDMTDEQWQEILNTNLSSVFYVCRECIPEMVRQKEGKIINISSVWGCVGASCEAAYSATKAGVNGLTMALAKELAPSHISVNAIACGAVDTQMNDCFTKEELQALAEEIPAGRMAAPEEVARAVSRILDAGEYLTGQVIRLDGGWI